MLPEAALDWNRP